MMRSVLAVAAVAASGVNAISFLKGDPECKFGIRSFPADGEVSVCCPKYCGECNDYATCSKVNGQASENACCASKVQALTCDNDPNNAYCIGKCTDKSAPCSLGVVEDIKLPDADPTANADCNNAVGDYKEACENTVKGVNVPDVAEKSQGPAQWDRHQKRNLDGPSQETRNVN